MNLLSIAHVPPVVVGPESMVIEAVDASLPARVGAVAVVENGRLTGIFTERDMMYKVVHNRMDPETTPVRDVMTSPVVHVPSRMPINDALELMLEQHFRHLPICDDDETVEGMLSIRNVLQCLVGALRKDLNYLEAFITDSPCSPHRVP